MFNATFSNISVTSWWSVLLMGETGADPDKINEPINQKKNIQGIMKLENG
jgi:hypothetical protein